MTAKKPVQKSAMPGRSVADFRSTYDKSLVVPAKIDAALARIGEEYRTAVEFIKEAGVSVIDLANFREQYEEFIVVVKIDGKSKDIWFGNKEVAAEARNSVR